MRKFFALALLVTPLFASADCTEHLQTWAKTLQPGLKLDSEHAVCKINPGNASQTLAALPFAENVDADGQGDYGLGVIVADTATGKIIARHYQPGAIVSDAIFFESLALDTARYQLTPTLRAFGVRISHTGSSRVNPYSGTLLNLYVLDGQTVRPVMDKLEVRASSADWDGACNGDFTETERTISIAGKSKNGLASLLVEEKTVHTKDVAKGDDCETVERTPVVSRATLEYDGQRYPVPAQLARAW
ncbi:hypothetical protein PS3A_57860 [Pseudomonas sp. 3A(2025)]